jgi:hypothetical protein
MAHLVGDREALKTGHRVELGEPTLVEDDQMLLSLKGAEDTARQLVPEEIQLQRVEQPLGVEVRL